MRSISKEIRESLQVIQGVASCGCKQTHCKMVDYQINKIVEVLPLIDALQKWLAADIKEENNAVSGQTQSV